MPIWYLTNEKTIKTQMWYLDFDCIIIVHLCQKVQIRTLNQSAMGSDLLFF